MAGRKEHYYAGCALGFSITQIVFGAFCIILQIHLILGNAPLRRFGQGIWAGAFVSHNKYS